VIGEKQAIRVAQGSCILLIRHGCRSGIGGTIVELKKHLRLILASPKDVRDERDELEAAVADINRGIAAEHGYHIDVHRWETDSYPQMHLQGPQGLIDEKFQIHDSDVVVGIFWTRLGTRLPEGRTGTEHELGLAYDSWKQRGTPQVMVYFKMAPRFPVSVGEIDQWKGVFEFRESFPREGLFGEFPTAGEFRTAITNDLTQYIRDLTKRHAGTGASVTRLRSQPPQEDIAKPCEQLQLAEVPLYTFCGLRLKPRDGEIFQDFRVERHDYINPNPVSFMWADAYRGNAISAMIIERDPPELQVSFENKPMSYPSNVAIRPLEERALRRQNRTTLCLEAAIPDGFEESGVLDEVFLAVRLVNGWNQHWAHGPGAGTYRLFPVGKRWTTISLPLQSDEWWRFTSDGNYIVGPVDADFSLLGPVIFEVGGEGVGRPGPGRGRVSIRGLRMA
jgi:hypothetical protein